MLFIVHLQSIQKLSISDKFKLARHILKMVRSCLICLEEKKLPNVALAVDFSTNTMKGKVCEM